MYCEYLVTLHSDANIFNNYINDFETEVKLNKR